MYRDIAALRESIDVWVVPVSRFFPGVTPVNVWDLPLWAWQQYVNATKELVSGG